MKHITPKSIIYPGVFGLAVMVVFAQQSSPDILADFSNSWNNFVSSGQMVAMFVGIALGYLIRMFTSY
ncbi:hypothetical protein GlitD10_2878 [Gloeomargarita lithophora Alchichica-D10]|uniref:Uncharacterized protein n=1 Tax=Gloeomargarita lithophora Alchichica-D10 TaxID=1188229 RepID=A0A1J0AH05_9CYAN|nr:hypothetical protein [Gloeomargarita lithophora]APB35222.1 hypothetical protein GlitD10_2878 [Gloeomargarita lithophora Alchichica-D10]